ncbi:DNA mismatch repair endonuclease MutL [Oceanisphaera pacifica]|uniref:DNA mismatch repair protein MutL n=1 Tax=Oceanisphaera pacifica TaxID=2818389 RepID=A0ABS3NCF0_9GAMM|nr:DNA mismatch repair endonuclease MutL [Oceanisphaera pacifica]MBO1518057.1 DNA mismatch repair endonuclease MutL [Oceanisphaera pacifica]
MAIQILPARLANQIAAGEVVERPASVVKELIENSLDAGATRIDIDIEKGGAKLIRIRDNGSGIGKDELALALSRHATSKVSTLEDLERIMSLGFRGEALASISSVARLTLTAKTPEQSEAWQAMAEGRDMEVKVMPASHPKGATIEVRDLFFNTPARRKFMRTEKTEFGHIDEVIRRIGLSRFDVDIMLRHNGKQVRQYRAGNLPSQQDKRVAAVCGPAFIQSALKIDCEHHGFRLWGWLAPPSAARAQNDVQYTYVNGRMMRDKLLNHAIRQAYGEQLPPDTHGAFVLYFELDATEVDVNVHPAKHEVRFHQSRLVHDFIYQVLAQALEQAPTAPAEPSVVAPRGASSSSQISDTAQEATSQQNQRAPSDLHYQAPSHGYGLAAREMAPSHISRGEWQGIDRLLTTVAAEGAQTHNEVGGVNEAVNAVADAALNLPGGQVLQLVKNKAAVIWYQEQLWLCELNRAQAYADGLALLAVYEQGLTPQPLLLPIRVNLAAELHQALDDHQAQLQQLGLELKSGPNGTIILTRVPQPLRHADLASIFPLLLNQLKQSPTAADLCQWLTAQDHTTRTNWTLKQAAELWQELQPVLAANGSNSSESEARQADNLPFLQPLALEQQLDRWIHGD